MKKYFFLLTAAAALMTACSKNDNDNTFDSTRSMYVGVLDVDQSDSTTYTQDSVRLDFVKTGANTADIYLYQVSFSPRMPMKIDMKIASASYSINATDTLFSGNDIIPTSDGTEFSRYIVTNLNGTITNNTLTLSMRCGTNPVRFSGSIIE